MTHIGTDWRALDGVATAWFEASSLSQSAALAGRIVQLSDDILLDVRPTGVRVRLESDEYAEAVSVAARHAGLAANPGVLQHLTVVIETDNASPVRQFWQSTLAYRHGTDGGLEDPLRRDPAVRLTASTGPRPLRNRIHLDVVRPAAGVDEADLGAASGPYGVRHADPDGNEVDLVPGDVLGESAATDDWHAVFGAVAYYRVVSSVQQQRLVGAAAALADVSGFPLLIDVRPGLVIIDSGKDRWERGTHGLELDFADLAARVQAAAHEIGAIADHDLPRFVQLFLDAADVSVVRAFWVAALGYEPDRRTEVSDIVDPRRLNPVLVFQELDPAEVERRDQRNRIRVELAVPADSARARVDRALEAGGRLLEEAAGRWLVADPEGNDVLFVAA